MIVLSAEENASLSLSCVSTGRQSWKAIFGFEVVDLDPGTQESKAVRGMFPIALTLSEAPLRWWA
jgi:hypothetical protein